jgi:hypothetical protein
MNVYESSLRLSQNHLNLFEYCPRRFQYAVIEGLVVPASPQLLAGQKWGDNFHLVMQQQEMDLPVDIVITQNPELKASVEAVCLTGNTLFSGDELFRQSEYEQAFIFNGYRFTVVYDLLRIWDARGEIIDWKTYLKPQNKAELKRYWQTRLYLYALVESTALTPDQVSMTYCFVRARNQRAQAIEPQYVQISYTQDQHNQTYQDLLRITDQLTDCLGKAQYFPQVPESMGRCEACPFTARCCRGQDGQEVETLCLPALGKIEEVAL